MRMRFFCTFMIFMIFVSFVANIVRKWTCLNRVSFYNNKF